MRFFLKNIILAILFGFLFLPNLVGAQIQDGLFQGQLQAGAQGAGLAIASSTPTDPRILAGQIIKIALQVFGTLFVTLIVLAGYRLIKADGDASKIEQGYSTLRMAIVGLLIILASYSIATFVQKRVSNALTQASDQDSFGEYQE